MSELRVLEERGLEGGERGEVGRRARDVQACPIGTSALCGLNSHFANPACCTVFLKQAIVLRGERADNMSSNFWTAGCLYGATAVIFGAFGAHGLKSRINDPARLANWSTAAHYQVSLTFDDLKEHPF